MLVRMLCTMIILYCEKCLYLRAIIAAKSKNTMHLLIQTKLTFFQHNIKWNKWKKRRRHYLIQHFFIVILFIFIPLNAMSSQFILMYVWRIEGRWNRSETKCCTFQWRESSFKHSAYRFKWKDAYYIIYDNELIKIIRGFVACQIYTSRAL